jgi:hypothetical protein
MYCPSPVSPLVLWTNHTRGAQPYAVCSNPSDVDQQVSAEATLGEPIVKLVAHPCRDRRQVGRQVLADNSLVQPTVGLKAIDVTDTDVADYHVTIRPFENLRSLTLALDATFMIADPHSDMAVGCEEQSRLRKLDDHDRHAAIGRSSRVATRKADPLGSFLTSGGAGRRRATGRSSSPPKSGGNLGRTGRLECEVGAPAPGKK